MKHRPTPMEIHRKVVRFILLAALLALTVGFLLAACA